MPSSDLPYKLSTGEVSVSVANTDFLLPTAKLAELNTKTQKTRACGIYFADLNILKAIEIMQEKAPENATQEQLNAFLDEQENKLIDAMMENDKADIELELLGGMTVEYATIYANPGLVVKGDAVSAGLSENMEKRLDILMEITKDLAKYYPDLQQTGQIIAPLKDMVVSVNMARESRSQIEAMRAELLK